jgi:hypothetical protein
MAKARAVTTQRVVQRQAPAAARVDPRFDRAILKIALELKKPSARSYEAVVEQTIRAMRLDPVQFRRYLGENRAERMGLLLAAARRLGP